MPGPGIKPFLRTSSATPYDDCQAAASVRIRKLSATDLPLCCPMPEECVWNAHPRIYLALDSFGRAQCPYCGTRYELETDNNPQL